MTGKRKDKLAAYLGVILILIPCMYAGAQIVRWEMQKQYVAQRQSQLYNPTQPRGDMPYRIEDMSTVPILPFITFELLSGGGFTPVYTERYRSEPSPIVRLDRDIVYYAKPNEASRVVYRLNRNEEYAVGYERRSEALGLRFGYGLITYPTADPAWRYARPFLSPKQADTKKQLPVQELAYVKTEDIWHFWEKAKRENPQLEPFIERIVPEAHPNWGEFSDIILIADNLLYRQGVYASPNLRSEPWNLWCTLSVILGMVCLAAGWAGGKNYEKKKTIPNES